MYTRYFDKIYQSPDLILFNKNQIKRNEMMKQEILNIAQKNLNMYKRLLKCKKSNYSEKKLSRQYKQSQYYKKNACQYPSIDFYKTQRISNYFSTLNIPSNKITLFNNNHKYKIKGKKKTPYQKLFFLNEIKDINVNNYQKITLDKLNINTLSQRKITEYFKNHNLLNNYNEKKE